MAKCVIITIVDMKAAVSRREIGFSSRINEFTYKWPLGFIANNSDELVPFVRIFPSTSRYLVIPTLKWENGGGDSLHGRRSKILWDALAKEYPDD